jgi:predicted AAA+ superfamily ATPase
MIGQNTLLKVIEGQINNDEFPRFSVIVGPEGSGKKTLTMAIAYALNATRVFIEPKVDNIREMINTANKVQLTTVYVILDNNMSVQAKNALLKVCEETPKNAYIILLTSNISTITDTLRSRAGIYYMQPYSVKEILQYSRFDERGVNQQIITDLCETPGDVNKLYQYGANEFYSFVDKVINNIANVTSANALKIAESIDTKGGNPDKYDIVLFLRAFISICGNRMRTATLKQEDDKADLYAHGVATATNTLNQLSVTGINKGALLDIFILDIRKEWL